MPRVGSLSPREASVAELGLEVHLHVEHWRGRRKLWEYKGGDLIGSPGRDLLANRIGTADPAGRVRYIRASAIGTSNTAPAVGQTKLGSVVYQGTAPFVKSSPAGSATFNRSFVIGSTYSIRESGLFIGTRHSATLRGTMYSRGTFPVRSVVSGDKITVNYSIGFTSG